MLFQGKQFVYRFSYFANIFVTFFILFFSYNVELTGTVSVDAYELITGVKVSSTVHSSTGSTFSFELLNGGKGVDMKIDFPFNKQEIFSFDHKIAFFGHFLGEEAIQYALKSAVK